MVISAIDRVIEQIASLKKEMRADMHGLRNDIQDLKTDMNKRFSSLDNRVIAIETKLGMVNEIHWLDHAKLMLFGSILTYVFIHFHMLIK